MGLDPKLYYLQAAKSYALMGSIFYTLATSVGGLLFLGLAFMPLMHFPSMMGLFILFFALGISLTTWSWLILRQIDKGSIAGAKSACLVLGILGIFLAWVVGGIFHLLAYSKLDDAVLLETGASISK